MAGGRPGCTYSWNGTVPILRSTSCSERPSEEEAYRIGECIMGRLESLAKDHLYVYDLKPSNVVVRVAEEEGWRRKRAR